jgi:Glycosyltransferase family 87
LSRRYAYVVAGLAVAAVGTAAVVVSIASLQQDLAAYWVAGKTRWFGLDPYVNYGGSDAAPRLWDGVAPYRHSRFLYPPLAAEVFRLLALVPYRFAKIAFTGAAVAGWLLTARLVARRPGGRSQDALAVILAGTLFFPLYFHLERGQIDLLLLPLVVGAWLRRERAVGAGAALALAATFKPALLGLLPVIVALGRWRWAAATVGFCGAAAVVGLAIAGPTLSREYATVVLPRAALYGEGGTAEMLRREGGLPITDEDGERTELEGRSYKITVPPFDGPASASLPRRLAPTSPHWAANVLPYVVVIAGLVWAARRLRRRHGGGGGDRAADDDAELLLFTAAILACVVTSPTGWVMSFVWALPIAPLVWARSRLAPLSNSAHGLRAAWVACALSPLLDGWSLVAGAALVVSAAAAADRWTEAA